MRYAGKVAILLLFINELHVQCGTVLKTQNINETDSLRSLKGYEWAACRCENGSCVSEGGKNICKCNPGYGNYTETKCKACNCGPDTSCKFIYQGFFKPYLKECLCKPGYHEEKGKCVEKCVEDIECDNGSTCNTENGRCVCVAGTSGVKCAKIEDCAPLNCEEKKATCIFDIKKGQPTCKCNDHNFYYEEENCNKKCDKDMDCYNRGACNTENGRCVCVAGTSGVKCAKIKDCAPLNCEEKKATCIFDIKEGQPTCKCNDDNSYYEEDNCNKKCDKDMDCYNGGACNTENGRCVCVAGTSGVKCAKIEDCAPLNCEEKKATCIFDIKKGQPTCKCNDDNFYYEEGNCIKLPSTSTPTTTILSTTVTTEQSKETTKTTIDQSSTIDEKSSPESTSPVSTTSIPSTASTKDPDCNCGEYSKSCRYNWKGDQICECFPGYAEKYGSCEECNCGPYGSCSFQYGQKTCNCRPFAFEKNGICLIMESTTLEDTTAVRTTILPSTTQYCNCGEYSKSCSYNWRDDKICDCFPGYAEKYGSCEECNCGPYGSCSFQYGQKTCNCRPSAFEKNGICIIIESTTSESTTAVRTTILPSTTQYCNCGEYSKSCRYNWKGDKICDCFPGYAEKYGFCDDCNCGVNAQSCFYRKNGTKVCNCDVGYTQTNGYCSAICSEEKCVHGKCEIMGNGFKCRCNEGFTGQRCEDKIQIKSNKQDLLLILLLSVAFAIFILLFGMFCFLVGILNKRSKK